jgi:hypothetical protein
MFILLNLGVTTWAAIALAALILIVFAFAAIKKMYPEKKRKPLKRI